ncbi:S-adenosyl-L-methionine-dependent methyltransferase [Phascolomyces articulosus]|uniref:S-adenosyl-L-methionine-dependent methyltransferase n=1 Tax=Phascolomyces articulosus TaxID=60185 RepID=A0AAD5K7P7_9FUNG|nr:S-adenosyl-L-methionine-dependent methyltransferase [Phascolomyces articulosus]
MQHYCIKTAFGANFHAPIEEQLEQGITVLDSGCGPGAWVLDMAKQYPQSKFNGLDISEVFPMEIKPVNAEFQAHNIAHSIPFPDNHFDFIHQRLLVMGLRETEWPAVVGNFMRTLKPGGWLELTECTSPELINRGPKMGILMDAVNEVALAKGLLPNATRHIERFIKEAGFTNIVTQELHTPVNHGNKVGELLWKDFRMLYTAMRPIIGKAYPEYASEEAYEQFMEDAGEECKEYKSAFIWVRSYGQKPEVPTEN